MQKTVYRCFSKALEKELKASMAKIKHKETVGSLGKVQDKISKSLKQGNFIFNMNKATKMSTDFQKFMKDFSDNPEKRIFDYSDYANNPVISDHNRRLK